MPRTTLIETRFAAFDHVNIARHVAKRTAAVGPWSRRKDHRSVCSDQLPDREAGRYKGIEASQISGSVLGLFLG